MQVNVPMLIIHFNHQLELYESLIGYLADDCGPGGCSARRTPEVTRDANDQVVNFLTQQANAQQFEVAVVL